MKITHVFENERINRKPRGIKKESTRCCNKKHQTVIDDLKLGIKEMLASEGIVNEDELDLTQQDFNTGTVQESNRIAGQLAFANQEMKLLYDMAPTIHNTIQPGSVVVTGRDTFFVSASIEEFEVEGMEFLGCQRRAHSSKP